MLAKYILLIIGGIVIMQCGLFAPLLWAHTEQEKKVLKEEKAKAIEELTSALDSVAEFGKLLKTDNTSVKDLKKYLDEHKSKFEQLKLEALTNLNEEKLEKAKKSLKRVMKKQLLKSIKLRKEFFRAKLTDRRILCDKIYKIYQLNSQVTHRLTGLFSWKFLGKIEDLKMGPAMLQPKEFKELQEELLGNPQWTIEIKESGDIEYEDELASIRYVVNSDGKVEVLQPDPNDLKKVKLPGGLGLTHTPEQQEAIFEELFKDRTGINIKELKEEKKEEYGVECGVIVTKVEKDGPEEEAGVKKGDIITHLNDKPIKTKKVFIKPIIKAHPEDDFILKIKREDKTIDIELEL